LGNDSDIDSPALTAALVSGPSHGTLTLNANGSFTYTPASNYNGPDSFTYKASDGSLTSNVATVSITVIPVNDPPTVVVAAGGSCTDTPSGTLNLSVADVDGDAVSLSATSDTTSVVANAGIVLAGSGASRTVAITPSTKKAGTAIVTVKASDGH